ncbi:MAG TPA: ATP-binding cassette domain-containing protein [Candidatus Aquilonibacter sp.]|nr:ATP-binding cassette domain-containing protein [Candidatus Aquilonibacter sp.]
MSPQPLLEMSNITKSFPGVRALDGVTYDLQGGEIHAIVGENGAGKSTLMKILGGVYAEYGGEIRIDGRARRFRSVRDSEEVGVAIVFQELSLVHELTVGDNIFLGREPSRFGVVEWARLYAQATALLRELKLDIDPGVRVASLGTGRQQLVEIAKALSQNARILVMDEPTAALTDAEAESLFGILEGLRSRGIGIIYISHRLAEVFRLSDRITVLRDGKTVSTAPKGTLNQQQLISQMVGREVSQLFPRSERTPGDVVFEAKEVSAPDPQRHGRLVVDHVSFQLRKGEVLGIAGLMGAGRTELLAALFGAAEGATGEIFVDGRPVRLKHPGDAIAHGIGFVTEDRKRSGLVLGDTVLRNMTLVALDRVSGKFVTNESAEIAASEGLFQNLRIKASSLFTVVGTLSGGNQQKVVLAKWLMNQARVLFLDEPTRGIDVGAKAEIYQLIDRLAQSGVAIVLVSSELPEVLGLCDRILVLHKGRIAGEFSRQEATPEAVMACAIGEGTHGLAS